MVLFYWVPFELTKVNFPLCSAFVFCHPLTATTTILHFARLIILIHTELQMMLLEENQGL